MRPVAYSLTALTPCRLTPPLRIDFSPRNAHNFSNLDDNLSRGDR